MWPTLILLCRSNWDKVAAWLTDCLTVVMGKQITETVLCWWTDSSQHYAHQSMRHCGEQEFNRRSMANSACCGGDCVLSHSKDSNKQYWRSILWLTGRVRESSKHIVHKMTDWWPPITCGYPWGVCAMFLCFLVGHNLPSLAVNTSSRTDVDH